MKTHIKICGIQTPEEAHMALSLGADVIGLVFTKSKRQVTLPQAQLILSAIKHTKVVCVFKDQPVAVVNHIANTLKPYAIQVYDTQTYTLDHQIQVIRSGTLSTLPQDPQTHAYLIDSSQPGAGHAWDWQISPRLNLPTWLAGGLNPDNVAECIKTLKPYCVDVSSGVETEGKKDYHKLKAFIEAVKGARHDKT